MMLKRKFVALAVSVAMVFTCCPRGRRLQNRRLRRGRN